MPVDWKGKGGVVSEGFEPESLDTSKEFVLELLEMEYNENQTVTFQSESREVDRFKTVWQVEGHKTRVWQWFNLPVGFLSGAGVNDRSNVVLFAVRSSGRQVEKGKAFRLDDYFVEHMRIRCMLERQKDGTFYRMDLKTVFPYQQTRIEPSPQQVEDMMLKKMLAIYNTPEEALKVYREVQPNGDESRFWLIWNQIISEKGGAPAKKNGPIIDGDKGRVLATGERTS
jgi:hypothetical protein